MRYTTPISDSLRYGFAVGRVRVLETRLLKRSHFERLLAANDFAEQRRILSETAYGGYLENAADVEDVEVALNKVLRDLQIDFLGSANLPEPVVEFFGVRRDYDELRGLLKAEAFGIAPDELLSGAGSLCVEDLMCSRLPGPMAETYERLRDKAVNDDDELQADMIDTVVDAELYERIAELADRSKSSYIQELGRVMIDVANTKVFVRTRLAGLSANDAARHLLQGGSIPVDRFVALYRLPAEEAAARLVTLSPLRGLDPEALLDPGRFDVLADMVIARHLQRARMVAVGPEPVVAYILTRRAEVAVLRTLLAGKLAGVSRDVLRTRLRDVMP
ncbi:MAG: V-type ATPase subunit [Coriobacteriia bacterium]